MKHRRRFGIFASALLFTGVTLLPYDTSEAQRPCPDLVMQEPQLTGMDAYKYKLKALLEPDRAKFDMYVRMTKDLAEKIGRLGAADSGCVQNVRDAALQYGADEVAKASVDALVRFNTREARDALYALILKNSPKDNNYVNAPAAEALKNLDPDRAADAIVRRGDNKLYEILVGTGSNIAISNLIARGDAQWLAQFIHKYRGQPVVINHKYDLLQILMHDLGYCASVQQVYSVGSAIRELDSAEARALTYTSDICSRNDITRDHDIRFKRSVAVDALLGK
ncbi:MAG: hypothetical protein WC613_00505 [Candidatus Aenigmatarchaeota archaeon]